MKKINKKFLMFVCLFSFVFALGLQGMDEKGDERVVEDVINYDKILDLPEFFNIVLEFYFFTAEDRLNFLCVCKKYKKLEKANREKIFGSCSLKKMKEQFKEEPSPALYKISIFYGGEYHKKWLDRYNPRGVEVESLNWENICNDRLVFLEPFKSLCCEISTMCGGLSKYYYYCDDGYVGLGMGAKATVFQSRDVSDHMF